MQRDEATTEDPGSTPTSGWQEDASRLFLDLGKLYTPRREEIAEVCLDLVPAEIGEAFLGVDLGTGQGWLGAATLRRFPRARMIALDGSATMRQAAGESLAPFGERATIRPFQLEDDTWLTEIAEPVRWFVSSLVVHHLDGAGKRALFARLFARLAPGGALLLVDLVEPTSEWGRRHAARAWDAEVARQSLETFGDDRAVERFAADRWNLFTYPDPEFDKPSPLPEQLGWLAEIGFVGIDVFWLRAGHAVYGGYKPPVPGSASA